MFSLCDSSPKNWYFDSLLIFRKIYYLVFEVKVYEINDLETFNKINQSYNFKLIIE